MLPRSILQKFKSIEMWYVMIDPYKVERSPGFLLQWRIEYNVTNQERSQPQELSMGWIIQQRGGERANITRRRCWALSLLKIVLLTDKQCSKTKTKGNRQAPLIPIDPTSANPLREPHNSINRQITNPPPIYLHIPSKLTQWCHKSPGTRATSPATHTPTKQNPNSHRMSPSHGRPAVSDFALLEVW